MAATIRGVRGEAGIPYSPVDAQLGLQPVELVPQVGALAQDHGSRPFHELANFRQAGGGETPVAQFLRQPGGALVPEKLGPVKFSGIHGVANGFKGRLLHVGYLYIWSAVSWAANRLVR